MPFEEGCKHLIRKKIPVVEHLLLAPVTSPPLPTTKHMKRPSARTASL